MEKILEKYRLMQVSDLHIREGFPLMYRKEGILCVGEENLPFSQWITFLKAKDFLKEEKGDSDFSFQDSQGKRYRCNLAQGEGGSFLSIRLIEEGLRVFPEELQNLQEEILKLSHGLILVTGATGSGKSTSLRFFLEAFNREKTKKIICLEDPIEHIYQEKKSIFFQREIGRDSKSFAEAIRSALRQDPDILMIGEIRDGESLEAALQFAESGHLVFSTLHTENCVETIHKMMALSPKERQDEVRQRLGTLIRYLIAQDLIRGKDGKRYPVFEILKNNKAVANMIYSAREIQLSSVLESSLEQGMCTKKQCYERLVRAGKV